MTATDAKRGTTHACELYSFHIHQDPLWYLCYDQCINLKSGSTAIN